MSLMDTLLGVALMVIIFMGIFGVFRLTIKLLGTTKASIGAMALANERLEYIRSLPYDLVGTQGGIPAGDIAQNEQIVFNGITYNRRTLVQYVDDPADGLDPMDQNDLSADYKRVKIELTWTIRNIPGSFSAVTHIVPRGIESVDGGGTLRISVIDAVGAPVSGARVQIVNESITPPIDVSVSTGVTGNVLFPGGTPAGSNYEVTVSKNGWSTAQTYSATVENPNPTPGHLTVIEDRTTTASFAIGTSTALFVATFTPEEEGEFTDPFADDSKISLLASTTVAGGIATLVDFGGGYESEGLVRSVEVAPALLTSWEEVSWVDTTPVDTDILYRVRYFDGGTWNLVPDVLIPGNTFGTTTSPINLSLLSTTTYPRLILEAFLSTITPVSTPSLQEWTLAYRSGPTPLPNAPFTLRGSKIIGIDGGGSPIYKYGTTAFQTNNSGVATIFPLEWDNYFVTINDVGFGKDVMESCPPQPVSVAPGATSTLSLLLTPNVANSLLVTVRDQTGALVSDASLHLVGGTINVLQISSGCGQSFFGGLSVENVYTLTASKTGFSETVVSDISVANASTLEIVLAP